MTTMLPASLPQTSMRELLQHSFEEGNIPPTWLLHSMGHTYERGCLRTGSMTELSLPISGDGWRHVRVEVELEPIGGGVVEAGNDVFGIYLKLKENHYVRHQIAKFGTFIAEDFRNVPEVPGPRRLEFDFDHGRMTGSVDGGAYVTATEPAPKPFMGYVRLRIWKDCLVQRIRVLGADPLPGPLYPPPAPRRRDFFLDVTVDFYDDWYPEDPLFLIGERRKFSRAMYDEFFRHLQRCGVRRIGWNYHDMLHENPAPDGPLDIGDNFGLAVEMAHKYGMELCGVVKMLETAYFAPQAKAQPFARMTRKPGTWGQGINEVIQRIDLVKEDEHSCAFGVNDVSLFVSADNQKYVPYTGPLTRTETIEDYPVYEHTPSGGRPTGQRRRARVLRLSGLNIREKYFVIAVPSKEASFANTLVNLVHAFGEKGEETRLTYSTASNTRIAFEAEGGLDTGVVFDLAAGSAPTSYLAGFDCVRAPFILDQRQGFLALAREKSQCLETIHGSLGSPSYPEAHQWWLAWVQGILDAGADGVELRWRNHTSTFTWGEFGFEQPVRDEFLKRTGVDIWKTDDFDKGLWRRIRGEGYTAFLRAAHAMVKKAGKQVGLHIDWCMNMEPEEGAAMDIHWDWRTWLREGLGDYVILKEVRPATPFAQEILSLARPRGIATVISHYAFGRQWLSPGAEQILDGWMRAARDGGHDGYQFYDSAGLLHAVPQQQRVVMKNPAMRDVFRKYVANNGH